MIIYKNLPVTSKNKFINRIKKKKKKQNTISHKSHLKRQKARNIGSTGEGSIVKRNKTRVNEISLTPVQKRRVIHREHPSFPINVAFFPSPSDIIMAGHKGLGNGYRSTRKGTRRNETYEEPVRVCVRAATNTSVCTRLDALTGVLETGGRHQNHRLCSATGAAFRPRRS